jgi:20S proteasome alpha/beta subunit
MNLQTEPPGLKKIVEIGGMAVLCYSGSVPDGEEIIRKSRTVIAGIEKPAVDRIAEEVRVAYEHLKRKRIEETILRPWLGADFPQFQDLIVKASASQLLMQIAGLVSQNNLQTDMLVVGADDTGHHLFTITHPGVCLHMNTLGYATIGNGALHAGISLSLNRHNAADPLAKAIYRVYEAKKSAEVSPGVGKLTDMTIIRAGKPQFATQKTFEALAKVHKEHPDLSQDEQATIMESL